MTNFIYISTFLFLTISCGSQNKEQIEKNSNSKIGDLNDETFLDNLELEESESIDLVSNDDPILYSGKNSKKAQIAARNAFDSNPKTYWGPIEGTNVISKLKYKYAYIGRRFAKPQIFKSVKLSFAEALPLEGNFENNLIVIQGKRPKDQWRTLDTIPLKDFAGKKEVTLDLSDKKNHLKKIVVSLVATHKSDLYPIRISTIDIKKVIKKPIKKIIGIFKSKIKKDHISPFPKLMQI